MKQHKILITFAALTAVSALANCAFNHIVSCWGSLTLNGTAIVNGVSEPITCSGLTTDNLVLAGASTTYNATYYATWDYVTEYCYYHCVAYDSANQPHTLSYNQPFSNYPIARGTACSNNGS
jgi:hypothetical protein